MNKTFTVAGASMLNGIAKLRFSNDMDTRMAMLIYTDHTEIQLVALPDAMSKDDAAAFLATHADMQTEVGIAAVAAYMQKSAPKVAKPRKTKADVPAEPTEPTEPTLADVPTEPTEPTEPTLADVPTRSNGKFIARAVREEMLAELVAAYNGETVKQESEEMETA